MTRSTTPGIKRETGCVLCGAKRRGHLFCAPCATRFDKEVTDVDATEMTTIAWVAARVREDEQRKHRHLLDAAKTLVDVAEPGGWPEMDALREEVSGYRRQR